MARARLPRLHRAPARRHRAPGAAAAPVALLQPRAVGPEAFLTHTQYYAAMSLDGFIAEGDDTIDWLTEYQGRYDGPDAVPMKGSYDRFYEEVGAMVSGSTTYEWVVVKRRRMG